MLWIVAAPAPNPSIFESFFRSGPMAQFVLGVLVIFSIVSWAIMLGKWIQLRRADAQGRKFLQVFHQSKRFSEVSASADRLAASPLVGLFQAGYAEIDAQVKSGGEPAGATQGRYRIKSLEAVERSLRRASGVELHLITKGVPFLATTAAAAPFIGLFGTVWGIMVAFRDIGLSGSTSIVAVAPGISEALINTAAGLFAAIPALLAYNHFVQKLRQARGEMEDFTLEFLNLTERNFL